MAAAKASERVTRSRHPTTTCRSQRLSARSGHTSGNGSSALPRLAAECAAAWDLELEEPYDTPRSLVVPAGGAVLKLNAPSHFEADHEADALACWDGQGAVRLLARDDERRALLLERCVPGHACSPRRAPTRSRSWPGSWSDCPAPAPTAHPFRLARGRGRALDGGGAATLGATAAGRSSARSSRPRSTCSAASTAVRAGSSTRDLHAWNVLRAEREPWLVIDPKPLVGEREIDGVGPLRNAGFTGDAAARAPLARRACRPRDGPRAASRLGPCPRPRVGLRPRPVVDAVDRGGADDQAGLTACSVYVAASRAGGRSAPLAGLVLGHQAGQGVPGHAVVLDESSRRPCPPARAR